MATHHPGPTALAQRVIAAIRREGQRNIKALRRIQNATATGELRLLLVRIFDIALWFSQPAAGVEGARREITVQLPSITISAAARRLLGQALRKPGSVISG